VQSDKRIALAHSSRRDQTRAPSEEEVQLIEKNRRPLLLEREGVYKKVGETRSQGFSRHLGTDYIMGEGPSLLLEKIHGQAVLGGVLVTFFNLASRA